MRFTIEMIGPLTLLGACIAFGLAACTAGSPAGAAQYHVSSTRPSDQVTVENQDQGAVAEVYSDNGIGSATITLTGGAWPEPFLLYFHLQGLEGLNFAYGETVINVSVNTQQQVLQSVVSETIEEAIEDGNPHWMPVNFLDREGAKAAAPAVGGVIVVEAPDDFYAAAPPEFTINWIDFYR